MLHHDRRGDSGRLPVRFRPLVVRLRGPRWTRGGGFGRERLDIISADGLTDAAMKVRLTPARNTEPFIASC